MLVNTGALIVQRVKTVINVWASVYCIAAERRLWAVLTGCSKDEQGDVATDRQEVTK